MTTGRQPRPRSEADASENTALQELRSQYAQNDATMSEELKALYPILNFDQMQARHPNEWIAFVATAPQFRQRDAKGRVVCHASDREALDDLVFPFHEEHPDLPLSVDYTGTYEYTKSLVEAIRDFRIRKS